LFYTSKYLKFVVSGILWSYRTLWNQETSKLIRPQTLCIQIYPNHCSDHKLSSKIDFRVNPIAVALFYGNISISITSQISWTTSQTFKFKYGNLSIFTIGIILYFSSAYFLLQKWVSWSLLSTKIILTPPWLNTMLT
jgi:hypothetical protein